MKTARELWEANRKDVSVQRLNARILENERAKGTAQTSDVQNLKPTVEHAKVEKR